MLVHRNSFLPQHCLPQSTLNAFFANTRKVNSSHSRSEFLKHNVEMLRLHLSCTGKSAVALGEAHLASCIQTELLTLPPRSVPPVFFYVSVSSISILSVTRAPSLGITLDSFFLSHSKSIRKEILLAFPSKHIQNLTVLSPP